MPASPFVRVARSLRWWHAAIVVAATTGAIALPIGCSDSKGEDLGPGLVAGTTCEDHDGDGYGIGCKLGGDCNDGDSSITFECLCDHPSPGCACDTQGERVVCGHVESKVNDQLVCGFGDSVCNNGVWGECIINNTVTLGAPSGPGVGSQTLGGPGPCTTNPCDPYCVSFDDDPSGLTQADAGIVSVDGGLTLIGNLSTPPSQCTGGTSGVCGHQICETGTPLTQGCDDTTLPPQPTAVTVFTDDFSVPKGWTVAITPSGNVFQDALDFLAAASEWNVNVSATTSSGQGWGFSDPSIDTSLTADNKIAGVKVGGNATITAHSPYYIISPVIDASTATSGTLTYYRQLNTDNPLKMQSSIIVCSGLNNCQALWQNLGYTFDASWTKIQITLPASFLTSNLQIGFGIGTSLWQGNSPLVVSSWNIDDIQVDVVKPVQPPPSPGCVTNICATLPSCCTTAWDYNCTNLIPGLCGVTCGIVDGTCVTCYVDNLDHDGDGFSYQQGDCADCDPLINPGAFDIDLNGVDEDCNGTPDDEPAGCDVGLANFPQANIGTNIYQYVKAIDLCRTAPPGSKNWGVLTSPAPKMVQADAWPSGVALSPHGTGYGILPNYGNNVPQHGQSMLILSTGSARRPTDPNYVSPTYPPGGLQIFNNAVPYPPGFPKAGQDAMGNPCPLPNDSPGPYARDSSGLWMQIKVPTNAKSFSFDFNFFSAEYFTEVCTDHNDSFVALMKSGAIVGNTTNDNISFDSNGRVIGVNSAFFSVPGNAYAFAHPKLVGTGYDESYQSQIHIPPSNTFPAGTCFGGVCGGATDWLQTSAPVVPGEIITIQYSVWDSKYHSRDSMALIDNWQWSVDAATLQTTPIQPPPPVLYTDGYFVRDYDVSNTCLLGTSPTWGLWSWTAFTPSDSSVEYYVQTASTAAGLAAAPMDPLEFSDPPYSSGPLTGSCTPAPCTGGVAAKAKAALVAGGQNFDTQTGSSVVDSTLSTNGRPQNLPFVRITSILKPSTDQLAAPILNAWNLQVDCVPDQ